MRIIAGRFRGRRLLVPPGQAIRPTGERAREALFDVLEHGAPPVRDARFLDLFCGTGAAGLEAHSRGAAEVLLIEQDGAALQVAQANLARLGAPPGVRLLARDASRLGPAPHPFDLIFLDPPYGSRLADVTLGALARGDWLAGGARVIVELAATEDLDPPAGYTLERERRYGNAKFLFLRHSTGAAAAPNS
jgi:16S rRNA (guanine966-N2)-methyltransferase